MKFNSESLLSAPAEDVECPHLKLERPVCAPVKVEKQFEIATCRKETEEEKAEAKAGRSRFSRQYAHSYSCRLWASRPLLEEKIKEEWQQGESHTVVKKIAGLCENSSGYGPQTADSKSPKKRGRNSLKSSDHEQHIAMREGVVVVVVGTIFKQQPEKPSILQELVEDNPMVPTKPKTNYTSDKDTLVLEDETARVQLVPSEGCGMSVNSVVNGIICAVKGKPTIHGKFEVDDVLWATPKPSVWPVNRESDVEMIFVSGLLLGSDRKNMAHLDILFDYLQGLSGSPGEAEKSVKSISRLFILGDSFGNINLESTSFKPNTSKSVPVKLDDSKKVPSSEVAKKLDYILDQLSQTMEVYIIPGEADPAEPMFPQAPIHRCILPQSSRRCSFHSLSNPTRLEVPIKDQTVAAEKPKSSKIKEKSTPSCSLDIILSSGQTIKDAMKNTNIVDPVEMAHNFLKWGHLCPTAPDTLALHPGIKDDIFVLKSLPNIFIVGGQNEFGFREWKDTCIVTVPNFASTGVAVILDKKMNFVPLNIKLLS